MKNEREKITEQEKENAALTEEVMRLQEQLHVR